MLYLYKRLMRQKILVFIAFLVIAGNLKSQIAPKYSNEFLSIGVGAKALGMSNSFVANSDDVTSGYWNPAGLLGIKSNMQVSMMHSEYFAGIAKYDYFGWATRPDSASAVGISMVRFAVDDIPNTTQLIDAEGNIDYDRITTFSAADYGFLISYARVAPWKNLRYGGNVKVIRRKVGDFAGAWGFGFDLGAQLDIKSWKMGAVLRDATSTFNAWSFNLTDDMKDVFLQTGNELPSNGLELTLPRLLTGLYRKFDINEKFSVASEVDLDFTFDGKRNTLIRSNAVSIDPHAGIEAGFKNIVFLRLGAGNFQHSYDILGQRQMTFQPNLGVGLKLKTFSLDYALTDLGDRSVALYSNVFSLKVDINKK